MTAYLVRSLFTINADNPIDAVEAYKDKMIDIPLDEMVFRAEEYHTGVMHYVYEGETYTMEGLLEHLAVGDADFAAHDAKVNE